MIVYAVNDYVDRLLVKHDPTKWGQINAKVQKPLIPARQIPQVGNTKKPYIVYGSSLEYNDGDLGFVRSEVISYVMYGSLGDLSSALDLLVGAFTSTHAERYLNAAIQSGAVLNSDDKLHTVMYTEVLNTESPDEYEGSEENRLAAFLSVRVTYKVHSAQTDDELYTV